MYKCDNKVVRDKEVKRSNKQRFTKEVFRIII